MGSESPGLALSSLGLNIPKVETAAKEFKLQGAKEFTSVCHFCACGCGQIGYVKEGKLIQPEGATEWQEISWEEAIDRAAKTFKKARDENWIDTEQIVNETVKVNRTDAIGLIGGSQDNNEECYQLTKIFCSLGVMSPDNQTRVCHANTPPAMSAAFGRGAMNNPWYDLKNTRGCRQIKVAAPIERLTVFVYWQTFSRCCW